MSRGRDLSYGCRPYGSYNKIRTRIQVNKNTDSEFYHNLFCKDGGVYDMIEAKMPWLAGSSYFIQQDGARPYTANGTLSKTLWPVVLAMDSFLS